MSAPPSIAAATEALTIGRAALRQLHDSLLRDAPDAAVSILQEVGFAAGGGVFQAFCGWLPAETTIFLMSRRLWTRVWVSNSSCHPRRQRAALKRPHTMTHVIGSCDCAVGGQGQTMAGWKQETSRSAS